MNVVFFGLRRRFANRSFPFRWIDPVHGKYHRRYRHDCRDNNREEGSDLNGLAEGCGKFQTATPTDVVLS
ncbi:MAG: hypothetical protein LBP65_02925 [Puniceicoccales bacterium]|nr:hypothetical protein [Puniceicoccales bacterium]